jgi:hypothetical protein
MGPLDAGADGSHYPSTPFGLSDAGSAISRITNDWARGALDPLTGRNVSSGVMNSTTEMVFIHKRELNVLISFWTFMEQIQSRPRFSSFAGQTFDVPFIPFRGIVNRMSALRWTFNLRFNHDDMKKILFPHTKDAVCDALGIAKPDCPISGTDEPRPRLWREAN